MNKIQWAALASLSAALGTAAVAGTSPSDAPSTATSTSGAQAPRASAPVADGDGFRPSEFAGVSVRERPAAASSTKSPARGWIKLMPGEPRSRPGVAESRGFTILRREKGTTALGGDKLVGAGLMHAEIATRDEAGRSKRQCVAGESRAAHARHTAHGAQAKHKAAR